MCGNMVDIQCAAARKKKKKIEKIEDRNHDHNQQTITQLIVPRSLEKSPTFRSNYINFVIPTNLHKTYVTLSSYMNELLGIAMDDAIG